MERKPTQKVRLGAEAAFDIYEPEGGAPRLYADGFGAMALGPGVVSLDLFQVNGMYKENKTGFMIENRNVVLRITVPLSSYVEMCAKVLGTLSRDKSDVLGRLNADLQDIDRILSNVKPVIEK